MFDTHCHLNFSSFKKNLDEVIEKAKKTGVDQIVVPGTDISSSKKAVEIANKYEGIYATVGIHPHHIYEFYRDSSQIFSPTFDKSTVGKRDQQLLRPSKLEVRSGDSRKNLDSSLTLLLRNKKVVAIGEVGLDRHIYKNTKYENYQVDSKFIGLQIELFKLQVQLAIEYDKSLIIHNRETIAELLKALNEVWDENLSGKTVFHCCEPDEDLLRYAKEHKMFIGVDGDITYRKDKQEFIKRVPLSMLVLETDSPFLLPEPLRTQKKYPNEPKNILLIAEFIAKLQGVSVEYINEVTTGNANMLFQLTTTSS